MKEYSDKVLEHYGVKGMRWGVRKKRETSGKRRWPREGSRNSRYREQYQKRNSSQVGKISSVQKNLKSKRMSFKDRGDYRLAGYLKRPGSRHAMLNISKTFMSEALVAINKGDLSGYKTRKGMLVKIGTAGIRGVINTMVQRNLGKRVLSRYDDSGRALSKPKGLVSKEQGIEFGIKTSMLGGQLAINKMAQTVAWKMQPESVRNEQAFKLVTMVYGKSGDTPPFTIKGR
jgi:hypothetical protein